MNLRKAENYINVRLIVLTFLFNVVTAFIFLLSVNFLTGDIFTAILYTFISWSVTVCLSVIYWIWYLHKKIKVNKAVKRSATMFLIAMYIIILVIVLWTLNTLNLT